MPFKIKTLNNISQQGLKLFGDDYAVAGDTSSPDAVLVRSLGALFEARASAEGCRRAAVRCGNQRVRRRE